jgi:hypothetical protein
MRPQPGQVFVVSRVGSHDHDYGRSHGPVDIRRIAYPARSRKLLRQTVHLYFRLTVVNGVIDCIDEVIRNPRVRF